MMFGESPFSTAPFSSYAGEVHNAFVTISGTNAVWNSNTFSVNGQASISLGSANSTWNTNDFTVEIFNSANTAEDTTSKEEDYEGDEAGECSDEADNDKDGLFDCDDDTCAGSPACKATDIVEAVPEEGLSSLSIVPALISIGLLAIFRRK